MDQWIALQPDCVSSGKKIKVQLLHVLSFEMLHFELIQIEMFPPVNVSAQYDLIITSVDGSQTAHQKL